MLYNQNGLFKLKAAFLFMVVFFNDSNGIEYTYIQMKKKVYITLIMKFGVNIKKDAKIYYTIRYTSVYNETVFAFTWMLF